MSGLEALTSLLSIACNIMQVISFAHGTISFCRAIYQGKYINEYSDVTSLSALSAQLQTHYEATTPRTSDEKQLGDIAKKCNIAARALEEEVEFLKSHNAKGHLAQTLRIAVKTNWRKSRLERLDKSLRNDQHTMESYLLARVCKRSDAIELQQRQGFEQLSKDIQFFISQYTIGHTKAIDLIKTELVRVKEATVVQVLQSEKSVRNHISSEVSISKMAITTHVTQERNEVIRKITQSTVERDALATTEKQRDQLLQSLRFPTMNARKNDVADAHKDTFRWIFEASEVLEDEDYLEDSSSDASSTSWVTVSDDSSDNEFGIEDKLWDNFDDWLKSDSNIYWISGKPASGKSTLMKYILNNPLTKSSLETWGTDPVILSHFLWKPGLKMQNSIKGFLCSILHQAFNSNTAILDSVLANSKILSFKISYDDWSTKELKDLSLDIMGRYPSPLCIFLDGLDEICPEDGPLSLLELVDHISELPNVKICVASRPEPLLQSLHRHQQLRLQDLTEKDMRRFANAQITPYIIDSQITEDQREWITDTLIDKAEGVFLWLHLAIRSLNRGLMGGDTLFVLYQRLKEMPNELSALYSNMWTRMNEDTTLYQNTAAWYFNFLITLQDLSVSHPSFLSTWWRGSVFLFMAAKEMEVQDTFIYKKGTMNAETLKYLCGRVQNDVIVRCAGLLETTEDETWKCDSVYEPLLPYAKTTLKFIHRTAYDYLTDNEEGILIRMRDSFSLDATYTLLAKANLIRLILFPTSSSQIYAVLTPLALVKTPNFQVTDEFLQAVWCYYDKNPYSTFDNGVCYHFAVVTACPAPAFKDFVLSIIAKSPNSALLATCVLRNIFDGRRYREFDFMSTHIEELRSFTESLLYLGASVRSKGINFRNILRRFSTRPCPKRTPVSFLSPLGTFISGILERPEAPQNIHVYGVLQFFMENHPDLEERIPLRIVLPNDQNMSIAILSLENFLSVSVGKHITFILSLNVALLVQTIHEYSRKRNIPVPSSSSVRYHKFQAHLGDDRASANQGNTIALILSEYQEKRRLRFYRVDTSQDFTGELLALLLRRLGGDKSYDLRQEVYKHTADIVRDIQNGSTQYEEVHEDIESFLANQGCGYRWYGPNEEGN
ncbi:hypothetical protein F4781DRAFT_424945 [Annulohypoxylon bovei var. microspora]|nr:hypothetical protein F4781DRAFT_424945 [Annulohypoxylon bovei var. microspora]